MHDHLLAQTGSPITHLIANRIHEIEFALLVIAFVYHLILYRRQMF
ncbi:MAG: hypothetical protein Q8R08_00430 [bacterium]|nr:hypothetical protein [bacterium]